MLSLTRSRLTRPAFLALALIALPATAFAHERRTLKNASDNPQTPAMTGAEDGGT